MASAHELKPKFDIVQATCHRHCSKPVTTVESDEFASEHLEIDDESNAFMSRCRCVHLTNNLKLAVLVDPLLITPPTHRIRCSYLP